MKEGRKKGRMKDRRKKKNKQTHTPRTICSSQRQGQKHLKVNRTGLQGSCCLKSFLCKMSILVPAGLLGL